MTNPRYQIVSDREAASRILKARGAYHAFFGAGLSVEAGVPTADQICARIARSQLYINGFGENADPAEPAAQAWLAEHLAWDRSDERYARCIRTEYANPADRVAFFREELAGVHPSFAHHAAAILMTEGVIGHTCLTTNFDKLIENAFAVQGTRECQPLRMASEVQFWRPDPDRCFCMKLHGDYDTHNVLNTSEETVRIDDALRLSAEQLLVHQGLLVLGVAGYEKSLYSFFDELTTAPKIAGGALNRGLLWGVYVGPKPMAPWDAKTMQDAVQQAVESGVVGREIRNMMSRMAASQVQFAFFPVFGSGQFLLDLIELSRRRALIGQAEPFLDREMRLRRVFGRAKLSARRVNEHIRNLEQTRRRAADRAVSQRVERAFEVKWGDRSVWVAYGDIASRSYLGHESFGDRTRAVVSPDDTFLSIGGGVAVALAEKAGLRGMLHEVSKFVPVPLGESRVTSGGHLPVHYVIHAATIEVSEAGYRVTREDVRRTFGDVLRRAAALGVEVLSVPLLGAGVAGLSPELSFQGLLEGYGDLRGGEVPATVVFVVYREADLARMTARAMIERILDDGSGTWSDEPWPPRRS